MASFSRILPHAVVLLLLYAACTSTSSQTTVLCQDGDIRPCQGENDCEGTRRCENSDWTECLCDIANEPSSTGAAGDATSGGGATDSNAQATGGSAGEPGSLAAGGSAGDTGAGGDEASTASGAGSKSTAGAGEAGAATQPGGTGGRADTNNGGSDSGGQADNPAGAGGDSVCSPDETRCTQGERERCDGAQWNSEPCPPDTPTCDDGECVVRGPAMVSVGSFYVDSTEVTVAQYQEFLAAKGDDTSGQPEACQYNTEFWDATRAFNPETWPITYVDWCDAQAFCSWAGKRLCGDIGGGPIASDEFFDPMASQWFLACGGPNGASRPNPDAECNTVDGFGNIEPVASYENCKGYYPGLFDMTGNATEWIDACVGSSGEEDTCYLAGGSYVDSEPYCDRVLIEYPRNSQANPFGFRCCSR